MVIDFLERLRRALIIHVVYSLESPHISVFLPPDLNTNYEMVNLDSCCRRGLATVLLSSSVKYFKLSIILNKYTIICS